MPSMKPSTSPTLKPTQHPTTRPSAQPSASPTCKNMAWHFFFVYCEWFLCLFFFFPLEDLKYSKWVFHIVGCFVAANENKLKHICTHISFYWLLICSYLLALSGFQFWANLSQTDFNSDTNALSFKSICIDPYQTQ